MALLDKGVSAHSPRSLSCPRILVWTCILSSGVASLTGAWYLAKRLQAPDIGGPHDYLFPSLMFALAFVGVPLAYGRRRFAGRGFLALVLLCAGLQVIFGRPGIRFRPLPEYFLMAALCGAAAYATASRRSLAMLTGALAASVGLGLVSIAGSIIWLLGRSWHAESDLVPFVALGSFGPLMGITLAWPGKAFSEGMRTPPHADLPLCSTCGYNLRGNVSGVCPECGTVRPKEQDGSA